MINLVNSRVFVISCEPLRRAEKRCRQLLDALRIRRSGVRLPPGTRFPNTGVSSARLYWENKLAFFAPKHVAIPVAVSVFPDEIYAAPRSWVEKAYPKLIHYNRLPKGGHFAAWEQPEPFGTETGLRSDRFANLGEPHSTNISFGPSEADRSLCRCWLQKFGLPIGLQDHSRGHETLDARIPFLVQSQNVWFLIGK